MSETPRTDAEFKLEAFFDGTGIVETVLVEFAQELETELAEAQKRFTAEDVRQISIKLLEIMKEFAPAEDKELKKAESAFVMLYDRLLQEEKSRNGK